MEEAFGHVPTQTTTTTDSGSAEDDAEDSNESCTDDDTNSESSSGSTRHDANLFGEFVKHFVAPPSHQAAMKEVVDELHYATAPNRRAERTVRGGAIKLADQELLQQLPASLGQGGPAAALDTSLGLVQQPQKLLRSHSAQTPPMLASSPSQRVYTSEGEPVSFVQWQQPVNSTVLSAPGSVEKALDSAVKQRASTQCMPLLVANQAARMQQRLRKPTFNVEESASDQRQAVRQLANNFDVVYAQTQEAMTGRLCFDPPKRSHTATAAEVNRVLHRLKEDSE